MLMIMRKRVLNFLARQWKEWRRSFYFVVFVMIPVKSTLADWNWVPTGSMNPTIVLFLNGRALDYGPLSDAATKDLQDGLREGSVFAEEDLAGHKHAVMSLPQIHSGGSGFGRIVVPVDKYFVMGDNRDNSNDSRMFGFAERRSIVGRAQGVIVSFNKLDKYQPRFGRFFSRLD